MRKNRLTRLMAAALSLTLMVILLVGLAIAGRFTGDGDEGGGLVL